MTGVAVKVVFDTNILVSGHFWKGSPYRCLLAVEAGLIQLVLPDPIVSEFPFLDRLAVLSGETGDAAP